MPDKIYTQTEMELIKKLDLTYIITVDGDEWLAYFEGMPLEARGTGNTPQAALNDMLQQLGYIETK